MRVAPPLKLRVEQFQLWQAALMSGAACAFASSMVWVWTGAATVGPWKMSAVCIGALLALPACFAAARCRPFNLEWDTETWRVQPDVCPTARYSFGARGAVAATVRHGEMRGDLRPVIDLGYWMLLKLDSAHPALAGRFAATRAWLPVQRRGLETQWHALRCAVYSPRPPIHPASTAATSDLNA